MRYNKHIRHQLELKQKHQNKKFDFSNTDLKLETKAEDAEHHDAVQMNIVASSYVGIFICLILDLVLGFTFDTSHIYIYTISLAIVNCALLVLIFLISRNWLRTK